MFVDAAASTKWNVSWRDFAPLQAPEAEGAGLPSVSYRPTEVRLCDAATVAEWEAWLRHLPVVVWRAPQEEARAAAAEAAEAPSLWAVRRAERADPRAPLVWPVLTPWGALEDPARAGARRHLWLYGDAVPEPAAWRDRRVWRVTGDRLDLTDWRGEPLVLAVRPGAALVEALVAATRQCHETKTNRAAAHPAQTTPLRQRRRPWGGRAVTIVITHHAPPPDALQARALFRHAFQVQPMTREVVYPALLREWRRPI
jgi:hypothetical protein